MNDETSSSNLKTLVDSASLVFFGTILQLAIAFLAKALMARYLEVADYGVVSLGILTINVTTTVALLGLDKGISRFLPRFDERGKRLGVVYTSYGIAVPLGLFFAAGVYTFAPWIAVSLFDDPSMTPVLRVMFLGIPVWVLFTLGEGVIRGLEETLPRIITKNLILPGTRFLFVAIVVVLGWGVRGVAGAYIASYAVAAIVITYFSIRGLSLGGYFEVNSQTRDLLAFSIPLTMVGFSSFLLRNIDLALLGYYRGSVEVGIYNVAYPIARLLTTTPAMFGYLFVPIVSRMHSEGEFDEAARLYQVTAKWLFILASPLFVLMALFPGVFISIFGDKYNSGSLTLIVLSAGFFLSNVFGNNGNVLQSFGRSRALMWVQIAATIFNLGLNFFLIPPYGFLGAGVATAASYVLRDILTSVLLYRYTGIHPVTPAYMITLLIATGFGGGAYFISQYVLGGSTAAMVGVFVVYVGALLIGFLLFGIQQEDLELVDIIDERLPVDLSPVRELLVRYSGEVS